MGRDGQAEPFSGSAASEEGFFEDNLHPKPQNPFLGAVEFARGVKAAVATAAFSFRLTLEGVVDVRGVESEVVTEGEVRSRERQTSFINFSSNSLHKGTI